MEENKKKANWYEFNQNNSGGNFITNSRVCHRLFIESLSEAEAYDKAERLGVYFDGCEAGIDCECCGDRWSRYAEVLIFPKTFGTTTYETIEGYAQMLADQYGATDPDARIFYLDGTVKEIFSKRKLQ